MGLTISGGLYLDEKKNTADAETQSFPYVDEYIISLCQNSHGCSTPVVNVGDRVLMAQKIAVADDPMSVNIHSPISGTVTEVFVDNNFGYIILKNDYSYELSCDVVPFGKKFGKTLEEISVDDLIQVVKEAGICGMSGAGVPTWKKLSAVDGNIKRIIVNCIECEPYLTANHRLLTEDLKSVVLGLKILLYAFRIQNAVLAVSDRDQSLVKKLKKALSEDEIAVRVFNNKYPQGDERQLVYSLTGREVPAFKSTCDYGILTLNPQTVSEIYNAFVFGMPSIYRNLTVDGDMIKTPKNLRVPIGTPTREIIEFCGVINADVPLKIIHGGVMMGNAVSDLDEPITKTTTAVLAFKANKPSNQTRVGIFDKSTKCIKCAKCVDVCPVRLDPSNFVKAFKKGGSFRSSKYGAEYCTLCSLCEYVCPANIPLIDYIKKSKEVLHYENK